MTLHKLEALGYTKAQVKKTFESNYERPSDDDWSNRVKALLASKRTAFSLSELEDLIAVMDTSHHQCVMDNPSEFHPLTVCMHERIQRKLDYADARIRDAKNAEAPEMTV